CVTAGAGATEVSVQLEGLDPGLPYFLRVQDLSATGSPNWGDFQVCVDSLSTFVEATASPDTICLGQSSQLNAEGSDDLDSYTWMPSNTLTNPNIANPQAFPFQTTTYTVTALSEGGNLIVNGDFENGTTSFSSAYTFGPDSLPVGQFGTLTYEGTYEVSNNPNLTHQQFASCPDHTSGSGNMLVVNGATEPNANIWCQTVAVQPNTDYLFSSWVTSVAFSNPAVLQFSIDGVLLGAPYSAPFGTCFWSAFSATWNSGLNTNVEICITNQNIAQGGNDFALDDIAFRTFVEVTDEVTVHVSAPSLSIDQTTNATCTGICDGSISVSASGGLVATDYSYSWSNNATSPTLTDLCGGNYSVTATDDAGCAAIANILIQESTFDVTAISLVSPCDISTIGSAQAIVSGGTMPYSFEWNNGEMTEVANNLIDGVYEVTVTDSNGCNASASVEIITNPNGLDFPITASDEMICAGESVTLSTDGGPLNAIFMWSTGQAGVSSITVSPTETTSYSLDVLVPGDNIIINGDFEDGSVGFTSDYIVGTGGPWGPLSNEGTYAVASNTNDVHSNFASCVDNTSGTGQMLIVNGSTTPNENVWCQEVVISASTDYQFSTWITSAVVSNPAILQFSINGALLGNPFGAPFVTCEWDQFFEVWNSGTNTTAEICIVNQNTSGGGNDFALDDISLIPLCSTTSEQTIEVSVVEADFASVEDIDCNGNGGSAEVSVSQGTAPYTYAWSSGSSNATESFTTAGSYTVQITDAFGCQTILDLTIAEETFNIESLDVSTLACDPVDGLLNTIIPASVIVTVNQGSAPYQFSLDGGASFSEENVLSIAAGGNYSVLVQDSEGCEDIADFSVEPLAIPTVSILAPEDLSLCEETIELSAEITGEVTSVLWSTGVDGLAITADQPGDYEVTVNNDFDCQAIATITISECGAYELPNIFSPNGDNTNDTFGLLSEGAVEVVEFAIYNRWGQEVHNSPTPWDGRFNGEPHPADVLSYRIVVSGPDGPEVLIGEVTLLR
ncbi:MAG: gliding motility-associated C-terminal domain-containing protein, partial [Bacteroidota bacterium]